LLQLDHKKKDYKFGFGLTLEKLIRAGLDLYLHFFSQTSLASFLASFDLLDKVNHCLLYEWLSLIRTGVVYAEVTIVFILPV
jgi:hypothetical protein